MNSSRAETGRPAAAFAAGLLVLVLLGSLAGVADARQFRSLRIIATPDAASTRLPDGARPVEPLVPLTRAQARAALERVLAAWNDGDIERYLGFRPVLARPDTLTYRSRKFIRRHRWGVGAAGLAAAALILFISVLIEQRNWSRYQEDRANNVKEVMIDLFQVSDPDLAQGRQVSAKEVMDRGAAELPERLAGQPVLLADMLETIGRVYRRLGDYDAAAESIEGALDTVIFALRKKIVDFADIIS